MSNMTKIERVKAVLKSEPVDRVPISIWAHYPYIDLEPEKLAWAHVSDIKKYDFDFIKLMSPGIYSVLDYGAEMALEEDGSPRVDKYGTLSISKYGIGKIEDWRNLKILNGDHGYWGKQVETVRNINKILEEEAMERLPIIQTLYSPLTTAYKLAGDQLLDHMKEDGDIVHEALQVITDTTINFIKENLKEGVAGFFFATQLANYEMLTEEEYEEFGEKYDLQLFKSFEDETYFNVVHIHGENSMFDKLMNYPANCLNWHDRWVKPTLKEARELTDKCLLGGINEEHILGRASTEEIYTHVKEAIEMAGKTGYMVGPGCTVYPDTDESHYYAARIAVERFGRY